MAARPLLPPKAVIALSLFYVVIATPVTGGFAAWTEEHGAIETLGFLLMLLAPVAFLLHVPPAGWGRLMHVPVFTFLLAKREAEHDWWIIDERLLSLNFYTDQGISLTALAGGIIVMIFAASLVTLTWVGLPALLRGLRLRHHWTRLLVIGVLLAIAGQLVEDLTEPLLRGGLTEWVVVVLEESSEMVFSLMVVLAILAIPLHCAHTTTKGDFNGGTAPHRSPRPDRLDGAGAGEQIQYSG